MNNNIIQLRSGDWMWNASILGFINIIGEENVEYGKDSVTIPVDCLDDFEEKYFTYFISTYEKILPWYRIISFKKTIDYHRENGYEAFGLKELRSINEYRDMVKRFISSNSFKAAFELLGYTEKVEELGKKLQKIKEPKDDITMDKEKDTILKEVEKQFILLEELIEHIGSERGRRYICAKNVIYSIINNAWNGVCFLYPQTKMKDMYEDYRNYFVDAAKEYLQAKSINDKYTCFCCGAPMKDLNNDMSFLNQSGFDTARKPSHVWNFINDVAICPLCKLVYSCLPAGFVYVGGNGIYVNANVDIRYNVRINTKLRKDIIKDDMDFSYRKIYAVLINALKDQKLEKGIYELADVQIVRYENEKYIFNLLPEITLRLIDSHSNDITGLIRTGYREGKENISLYEQVINFIFDNQNFFLLINKLLHYKLSTPKDCYFNTTHIINMLKINTQLIQNLGGMGSMDKSRDYLKEARAAGYYLRNSYLEKDPKTGKISGISYRLLNALKTGNRNMFMDTLLNSYMYVGKEVPSVITEILREDDELFSTIGYAFVACFIDGEKDTKNNNEKSQNERSSVVNG